MSAPSSSRVFLGGNASCFPAEFCFFMGFRIFLFIGLQHLCVTTDLILAMSSCENNSSVCTVSDSERIWLNARELDHGNKMRLDGFCSMPETTENIHPIKTEKAIY
ncbi:unnamed protein product [Laminaria digitata]